MKNIFNLLGITLAMAVTFISCEKDEEPDAPDAVTGEVSVSMNYVWGMNMSAFNLNEQLIHPMNGDTLNFSMFKHYVSNIKLINDDGADYVQPESYHLLDASDESSLTFDLSEVPAGTYSAIEITFGVDSTRNVSGAQTGALDVSNQMFWSWNSGYIMLKAEGTSPQAEEGSFAFHIGGFSGEFNSVMTRTISLPQAITVSENSSNSIALRANPAKLFHTFGSVSGGSFHMPGENAYTMAYDFNYWVNVAEVE